MKLILSPPVEEDRLAKIRQAAGPMSVVNAETEDQAIAEIADADAFFGKLTPAMLKAANKLRWVQSPTASLEHYIFPELVEHPCVLTNMRGLYYDIIASHVFGYILTFARNLHLYLRQQIQRKWEPVGGEKGKGTFATGVANVAAMDKSHMHVRDCTLGVIGLGSIGAEIARVGVAFGMRVLAVDPVQSEAPDGVASLWRLDRLDALLAGSDFVVIAAPHTPDTEGMFRRAQLQKMKPTAYLINIGRGAIVSLDDLVGALQAREIAGAALDVFEIEPLPSEHPLWGMENVIITPHVAACSVRLAERHLEVLLDNVARFVRGEPLRNVVNKEKWF